MAASGRKWSKVVAQVVESGRTSGRKWSKVVAQVVATGRKWSQVVGRRGSKILKTVTWTIKSGTPKIMNFLYSFEGFQKRGILKIQIFENILTFF